MKFGGYRAKDVAEFYGVTAQAVGLWVKNEGCPRDDDGTYNLKDVNEWRTSQETEGPRTATEIEATERKKIADAEIAENKARRSSIELGELEGRYLLRDEVEKGRVARIVAVKAAMEKMHTKLAPLLTMKSKAEVSSILYEATQEIMEQFSSASKV